MGKEEKTLLITVAVALGLIWFFKPKSKSTQSGSSSFDGGKYDAPKVASEKDKKSKEDAVIGLQAMRDAIDNKEPKRELDKLNSMILQDYKVKITRSKTTGKLRAMSSEGKVLAEEN